MEETERLSNLNADELMKVNIPLHRAEVNVLLLETSELVWKEMNAARKKRISHRGADLMGANLKKKDLQGANLRGAYLIAANLNGADLRGADLIGADLRDADIRGADFTNSIFLTQVQINAARGDTHTKLPKLLSRPRIGVRKDDGVQSNISICIGFHDQDPLCEQAEIKISACFYFFSRVVIKTLHIIRIPPMKKLLFNVSFKRNQPSNDPTIGWKKKIMSRCLRPLIVILYSKGKMHLPLR